MNRIFALALGILLFATANPARADETIPLAGEWRFALDRRDVGTNENWFAKNLPDKIQLPGILEAQGYGDAISTTTPWVLSLYDHFWFLRADYAAYTNAGSVKVPFLCQPPRHFLGAAWYQRDVDIPTNWGGQRIVLFLERPKWKSTVWLDDQEIGSDLSLCTPHEFTFGFVPPGQHRLTVRVDNRMILPYRPDAHSISDSLDNAWNGIVGKIELRSTPPVWIENLQNFPNLQTKSVTVRGRIGNLTGRTVTNNLTLGLMCSFDSMTLREDKKLALVIPPGGVAFETEVARNLPLTPWDEFHPTSSYWLAATIGQPSEWNNSIKTATIPFRDFHTDGRQFILNGHPVYLRGTHFGGDFPLTGYPPTDVASWIKIFETCQDYGLNHMRFHSWCPPEAAFIAADSLGFYLCVEPGMWNTFNPGSPMEAMLYAETERIIKTYGNHPSLLMLSASNEPKGHWQDVLPKWAAHFRAADPRRLYTTATGFTDADAPGPLDQVDFAITGRIKNNRVRGETGWFGHDYADALANLNIPVIAHELGQWCAYPDFDVIKKFTGFMQPGNYEIFRDSAAAHGVLAQNQAFAQASGKFQRQCYQEEIEANLRTPGMAGFQLLDLHDYTGQGTALIGLLDPFWESKGYVTPKEFRKFCNSVVPLARLPHRVFTTTDPFEVPVEVANFSASELTNATAGWKIFDARGQAVASGTFAPKTIPLGKNWALGKIVADLTKLPAPGQFKLVVQIGQMAQTSFENDWNFWLYPALISQVTPPEILVTSVWDEARGKLAAGGNVLFIPRLADLAWNSPPLARVPIFWNALMGPTWSRMLGLWCDTNSPALATFPTEVNCDWQWTEIIRNTRAVNLDGLPSTLKPIVSAIDDWNRNYKLGVIFEAKVGAGKLLVCAADLAAKPVGQQLRRSLLDYMAGAAFAPATEISPVALAGLFFDTRIMQRLGATVSANGKSAKELMDGDPNTFWTSADARGKGSKHPHVIEISFPKTVALNGLVVVPRQNQREHQGDLRAYRIEKSADGTNWQSVATGELTSTFDEQRIFFGKTISTQRLRLTALAGFGTDSSLALAELAVIYAGPKLATTVTGDIEYQRIRTASPDIDAGEVPISPAKR